MVKFFKNDCVYFTEFDMMFTTFQSNKSIATSAMNYCR